MYDTYIHDTRLRETKRSFDIAIIKIARLKVIFELARILARGRGSGKG